MAEVKYYSLLRPIGPGTTPAGRKIVNYHNFDERKPCDEIGGREAWGWVQFQEGEEPDEAEALAFDLAVESKSEWWPIGIAIHEDLKPKAKIGHVLYGKKPEIKGRGNTKYTVRTLCVNCNREDAECVAAAIETMTFKVQRNRASVTQGNVDVFVNGVKLISYGDNIRFQDMDQFGQVIGGWASCEPDHFFAASALVPKNDETYHYSDHFRSALGIRKADSGDKYESWIESYAAALLSGEYELPCKEEGRKHTACITIKKTEFERINKLLGIDSFAEMSEKRLREIGAERDSCEGILYVEFDDGSSLNFDLCSGEDNYYDDLVWTSPDGNHDVVMECTFDFPDVIEFEAMGEEYSVKIKTV